MECIFCKIINNELPSEKIYESENFVVFLDIMPINPGHCLVVPKKHYRDISEIPEELGQELLSVVKIVSKAVVRAVNADGYNIGMNNGSAAGQVVMHAHIHIIPRFNNDGLKPWPQKKTSQEELSLIGEKVRSYLTSKNIDPL